MTTLALAEVAPAMQQAATALREGARAHKRASELHRRQARALMERLDRLREECARHGITLTINTEAEGRTPTPGQDA